MSSNIFIGAGTGNSSQAQQFFDRLLTPPTGHREALYSTLIDELVESTVWANLDCLYLPSAADAATGLTNLIQDAYHGIYNSAVAYPTFTVDRGIAGVGNNVIIDSNFNPTAAAGNYSLNDAMVLCGTSTTTASDSNLVTDTTLDGLIELIPKYHTNLTYFAINGAESNVANVGAVNGFWLLQRTGASAAEIFRDNVSLATSSAASGSMPNQNIVAASGYNILVFAIGKSLNTAQRASLDGSCRQYLQSVGAL